MSRREAGRRSSNKEVSKLIQAARDQGWTVLYSGGGHLIFRSPDKSVPQIIVPSTPHGGKRSIENATAQLRRGGLIVKNSGSDGWNEIGRFDTGWRAFNRMIEAQMQSLSNALGRIETVASRSRPGKTSYAVFLKFIDGPKPSLDFLESQYVEAYRGLQSNRRRHRTSRRTSRRRTSRR
jgi:hypothetical protein